MPTVTGTPRIDTRPEQATLGIRTRTPMKGMSRVIDRLFAELEAWAASAGIQPSGPLLLRYHVIDMAGEMEIEAAMPVPAVPPPGVLENSRVQPGSLPAGRYASLVYSGSGLTGNKTLIEWARANGLAWDRWDDPRGDAFRARIETLLTDPKIEPRKTRQQIEVAIKLADTP